MSRYARRKKLEYFFGNLAGDARILEVGCADGWVGEYAISHGWTDFVGIDLAPPAVVPPHEFIVGDINEWYSLGLEPESFDAVVAFEVVEHGDFFSAMASLLRPRGKLLVSTPVPHMDRMCRLLERARLSQRRTSPHTHLMYLDDIPPEFRKIEISIRAGISQWGVFEKAPVMVAQRSG